MAAQNEASISVSSAPMAARNCKEYTPEPVHFGTPKALLKSFSQCFRLGVSGATLVENAALQPGSSARGSCPRVR